jgi:predicted Zn finger-like uncharacterized protein
MLIVCPSCATSYEVQPASLEPNGRQVRCVRCRMVWHAELKQADRLMAAAEALAPGLPAELPMGPGADGEAAAAEDGAAMGGEAAPLDHAPDREPAEEIPQHVPVDELEPPARRMIDSDDPSSAPREVEAPSIAPADYDAGGPPTDGDADDAAGSRPAQYDIETFAARFSRRRAERGLSQWSLSRLQIAILVLLVLDSVIVGWRKDLVHVLPQTASLYAAMGLAVNVRGLSFDHVATSMEAHAGVPILVVQGNIVNDTGEEIEVPRLKLILRNAAKQEVYSWTVAPRQARLPAYQATAFHARLASPPPEGRDLLVRFLTRRDIVADTN